MDQQLVYVRGSKRYSLHSICKEFFSSLVVVGIPDHFGDDGEPSQRHQRETSDDSLSQS
jgi:hypothetical protein